MQDDDSDLEYELESCPSVSSEASAEAAACVKVSKINVISIKKKIKVWHLLSFGNTKGLIQKIWSCLATALWDVCMLKCLVGIAVKRKYPLD